MDSEHANFEKALNDYLVENCDVSDFVQETEVEEIIREKFSMEFAKNAVKGVEPFYRKEA